MKFAGGLLLLVASAAAAQSPGDAEIPPVNFPALPSHASSPAGFVSKGWKVEARATGDLNRDGRADAALVLHMADPRNLVPKDWDADQKYDSNPRMLVVLLASPGGGYQLAAADHRIIPRLENQNQEEPFDKIEIANGALKLKLHLFMDAGGWRMGDASFTLRWDGEAMRLIGYDADWTHRGTGETEEISVNYLTGRKLLKTGSIEDDALKASTSSMPKKPAPTLDQIGDGLMFDPGEQ